MRKTFGLKVLDPGFSHLCSSLSARYQDWCLEEWGSCSCISTALLSELLTVSHSLVAKKKKWNYFSSKSLLFNTCSVSALSTGHTWIALETWLMWHRNWIFMLIKFFNLNVNRHRWLMATLSDSAHLDNLTCLGGQEVSLFLIWKKYFHNNCYFLASKTFIDKSVP